MVIGLSQLLNKAGSENKDKFTSLIQSAAGINNMKFILVDTIDNVKTITYESWFKPNIDLSEGVWIGNGISNQFTLKVTTSVRILRQEIEPKFGYVIRKGKAVLVKFISDEEGNNE